MRCAMSSAPASRRALVKSRTRSRTSSMREGSSTLLCAFDRSYNEHADNFEGARESATVRTVLTSIARTSTQHEASPIVKWVGGKTRLLSQLLPLLPPAVDLMRHVEPFVGGAAMFFARRPKRALLCDKNAQLCA